MNSVPFDSHRAPHTSASAQLYWMLPGPAAFIDRVSHAIVHHRAVLVHVHGRGVIGLELALRQALEAAHAGSDVPLRLNVGDDTHIESDVGHHFGTSMLAPGPLARLDGPGTPLRTVVLIPRGPRGADKCRAYLASFAGAAAEGLGRVRLVVVREDPRSRWHPAPDVHEVLFNGALSADEMKAYVAMRMVGHRGPGPTTLVQNLVAEFAGFDAGFAEELMRLKPHELLALPEGLSLVLHRLGEEDGVWRETDEFAGTFATVGNEHLVHVLHEWHLASHAGPHQDAARRALGARYWRAALQSLMPWLEELRHDVIDVLRSQLQEYLAPTGGRRQRLSERTGRVIEIDIEDLECNDVVSMRLDKENPLQVHNRLQQQAVELCSRVTRVRNQIAHMKPPSAVAIMDLVHDAEVFLSTKSATLCR